MLAFHIIIYTIQAVGILSCVARTAAGGAVEAYTVLGSLVIVAWLPVLAPPLRVAPRFGAVVVSAGEDMVKSQRHHVSHHGIVARYQHSRHGFYERRVGGEGLLQPFARYGLLGERRVCRHPAEGIPVGLRHLRAAPAAAVTDVRYAGNADEVGRRFEVGGGRLWV